MPASVDRRAGRRAGGAGYGDREPGCEPITQHGLSRLCHGYGGLADGNEDDPVDRAQVHVVVTDTQSVTFTGEMTPYCRRRVGGRDGLSQDGQGGPPAGAGGRIGLLEDDGQA
jgi:hypothetical protein